MTIKIFLGNLDSKTTPDNIRPLFEKYGEVVECDVLKNFGFVHMVDKDDANKAIAQLDGYSVDGNNIRVELSTGKKGPGGGGGGKFDKKGFGNQRERPYGLPPGRGGGDPRDFDRYPYPAPPPLPYDRYDPYYRFYPERDPYYSRMASLPERGYPAADRDRFASRDRLAEHYPPPPDVRDRLPPPRSFMEDRARALPSDPYFRERDPLAARPPPEYYDRKPQLAGGRGADALAGAAGAAGGRVAGFNGVGGQGDYNRFMDRPGATNMGGAAGGGQDYFRGTGGAGGMGQQGNYGRVSMGNGGSGF